MLEQYRLFFVSKILFLYIHKCYMNIAKLKKREKHETR